MLVLHRLSSNDTGIKLCIIFATTHNLSGVGHHEALKQRPAVHQECVTNGFDYLQSVICDVAEMAAP
jgi:hypothetical protein